MLDKLTRLVGGLIIGVWMARYLGPANFGLLNTCTAVYGLLLMVMGFGLDQVLVRYLVRYPSRDNRLMGTAVGIRCGVSLVLLCIGGVLLWLSPVHIEWIVFLIVGGSFVFNPFLILRQWFESKTMSKYVVLSELFVFVVFGLLKIVGILWHLSVYWFLFLIVFESVVACIGYGMVYLKKRTKRRLRFCWPLAKRLFFESWPMLLSGFANILYTRIDQVMLLLLSGKTEAGIYAVSTRVSEIPYMIPAIVVSSIFPGMTLLRRTNRDLYLKKFLYLFSGFGLLTYLTSILTSVISTSLIVKMYGLPYEKAGLVLIIHIWAFVFVASGWVSTVFLVNENLFRYAWIKDWISAVMNIALNLVLIPHYGAFGAAIATLISYSFQSVWGNAFFPKLRPLFWLQLRGLRLEGIPVFIKNWRQGHR